MLTYILFVLGFILLIKGADFLVEGSSSIARRLGISSLVVGLTIVSFGTSAPELIVNIFASLKGNVDIGIGNILGSNISNIFLILGISALIYPLKIKKSTTWKEIPLNFLAAVVLFLMANDMMIDRTYESVLTRVDGLILMVFFVIFMHYTIGLARTEKEMTLDIGKYPAIFFTKVRKSIKKLFEKYHNIKIRKKTYEEPVIEEKRIGTAIFMTIIGIIALAYGGEWVVEGAVTIAEQFGLSEALIGLTIVAVGTSLPELATSAVAAFKRKTDIAIGNVVGSNLFNIFWVLGLSAVIRPLPFNPMINSDILVYLVATVMLFLFCFTQSRHQIDRCEGAVFVASYVAYIIFLIVRG